MPGDTPGSTMWLLKVRENGRNYRVAIVSSASIPGYTLLDNKKYQSIITDYQNTFARLKGLKPDVFLASHGSFFNLLEKAEKIRSNPPSSPFIDPDGYKAYVERSYKAFRAQLKKERQDKMNEAKGQ